MSPMAMVLFGTLVIIAFLVKSILHFVRRHGLLILVWRFMVGHHLDGHHRTNAGYWTKGTQVTHRTGKASAWSHMPMMHRAGVRWVTLMTIVGLIYGTAANRMVTMVVVISAVVLLIALNERRMHRKVRDRFHTRGTVAPLTEAIAVQMGVSPQSSAGSVAIRSDFASAKSLEDIGTVALPDWYAANPAQREALEHLVRSRLGMDVTFTWHTSKRPMTVQISRAPIPPKMVRFADVLSMIRELPGDHILLGINGRGKQVVWDLSSEEPHAIVQATSRRGKTRLLLLIVAQILNQGAEFATLIDPKRVGVDEALAGVPGVTIHSNPKKIDEMWAGICHMREIMDERIDALQADRTLTFRKALLVIDEVSMFSTMSKVYWDQTRDYKTTKATPEIWNDVAAIVWEGAQVGVHCLVFGQRLDSSILGGMIESFGTRLLAGYTKRGYDRLVGINPMPAAQKARGRFLYFDGEDLAWIQVVLGTDQEFRDHALEPTRKAKEKTAIKGTAVTIKKGMS